MRPICQRCIRLGPYGKYRDGRATAQVIFAACSDFECGNETIDLTLWLRR
jgi:hypothetical protein